MKETPQEREAVISLSEANRLNTPGDNEIHDINQKIHYKHQGYYGKAEKERSHRLFKHVTRKNFHKIYYIYGLPLSQAISP
jgi:hypothetical protein